jgi:hypothetical protein
MLAITKAMLRPTTVRALLAAVLLAACGSSGSNRSSSQSAVRGEALALATCIRSHGVPNFPDPSNNGRGGLLIQQSQRSGSGSSMEVNGVLVSAPAFKAAMQACRKYLPNGGTPSPAKTAQLKAQALAMARCMRSHGVPSFPDPQFQTGPGRGFGIRLGGPGINPQSPAFQAAQSVCGPIFGKGPGDGGFRAGP